MSERQFKKFLFKVEMAYVMGYVEYPDLIDIASVQMNDSQWSRLCEHMEKLHQHMLEISERVVPSGVRYTQD